MDTKAANEMFAQLDKLDEAFNDYRKAAGIEGQRDGLSDRIDAVEKYTEAATAIRNKVFELEK